MFRSPLNSGERYILDFIQTDDGRRFVLCREVSEPVSTFCSFSSKSHSAESLRLWRGDNTLGENVRSPNGERIVFGGHGEWLTESEYRAFRNELGLDVVSDDD